MSGIEVRPATRFADVATMLGPKRPGSSVCWCLSHRLDAKTHTSLVGPERGEYVRRLTRRSVAPGVLAYEGDDVVGVGRGRPDAFSGGFPRVVMRRAPTGS